MLQRITIFFIIACCSLCQTSIPSLDSAASTYQAINKKRPFAISFGTGMSQTHTSEQNTLSPEYLNPLMYELATQQADATSWLSKNEHRWFALKSLHNYYCNTCQKNIIPLDLSEEAQQKILATCCNKKNGTLCLATCPFCNTDQLTEQNYPKAVFSDQHQQAFLAQIDHTNVSKQPACTDYRLPNYRLSIELADILDQKTAEIDQQKLRELNQFIVQIGNPFVFCHHYANPTCKSTLFQSPDDAEWFAQQTYQVACNMPSVTHICPISQPTGYAFHVGRNGTLPPFFSRISPQEMMKNMMMAHKRAYELIKEKDPTKKVYICHQYKLFKPMHSAWHPLYALELLATKIADTMYNRLFIDSFKKIEDYADGIALSLYPPLRFNGFTPVGDNTSGNIDEQAAYETIMEMHKAFPNKPITITETGCNTNDVEKKEAFIAMLLRVCKKAIDEGVLIDGIYFWTHTNDPVFYTEWGKKPGSTHFGLFDDLNPAAPTVSMNASGHMIKTIIDESLERK